MSISWSGTADIKGYHLVEAEEAVSRKSRIILQFPETTIISKLVLFFKYVTYGKRGQSSVQNLKRKSESS